MTETESRPAEPKTELEEQVRLISIGYYVVAGLTGLFSLIPGIHITIGVLALLGKFEPDPSSGDFPSELFGGIFVGVGLPPHVDGVYRDRSSGDCGSKTKTI